MSPGTPAPPSSSCSVSASSPGSSLRITGKGRASEWPASPSLLLPGAACPATISALGGRPWASAPVVAPACVLSGGCPRAGQETPLLPGPVLGLCAARFPASLPRPPLPALEPGQSTKTCWTTPIPSGPGPGSRSSSWLSPSCRTRAQTLDSFSVSPASTLKSPTNVSHSCPPARLLPCRSLGPESQTLAGPSGVPQKQGGVGQHLQPLPLPPRLQVVGPSLGEQRASPEEPEGLATCGQAP